ncbi:MAG: PAS domain-containing protein, partial [Ferrovibrio sp.]
MPRREDFPAETLRPWLGNIGIVAVERLGDGELRFRVSLSGTQLDSYRGFSITGQYLDDMTACSVQASVRRYRDCVENGEPVHLLHDNSPNSAIYTRMGKLLLPLSSDGVTVDRILMAMYPLPAHDGTAMPACT